MKVSERRTVLSFALGVVVGVLGLVVYATVAGGALLETARVEVLEGFTNGVNLSGSAIGFAAEADAPEGEGYILSGAAWSDSHDNLWHESFDSGEGPSCVPPQSSAQPLRLGIVTVPRSEDAPGRVQVVWFECLGRPSEVEDS